MTRVGTALRALAIDAAPLRRHRDFRLLWSSRGVSFFGSMITYVALPYEVYVLTESSLAVGLLGLAELTSLLAFAFFGGALADAVDRRLLLLSTESALLCCSLLLAFNASLDHPNLATYYVLAAVMAGLDAVGRPALEAAIPRLVDRDEMPAVSALDSAQGTVAMIAGPALGGVLIAWIGPSPTFLVDAGTFVASLVALAAMRSVPPPEDAERPSMRRVREGLSYAWHRQDLLGTYAIDFWAMFFGMPTALFPAIALSLGGERTLGLLYAAPAAGAFVVTITSGWVGRVHRHGMAITVAAAVWGVGIIVFGFARSLPLAIAGLMVAGAGDMVSGMFRGTMWNQTIPDSLRGRLASIELISYSSGPLLGNTEAGLATSVVGLRPSIVGGGVMCIACVIGTAAALPLFHAYDSRRPAPEPVS